MRQWQGINFSVSFSHNMEEKSAASISIFAIFRLKDISDAAYMNEEEY
jgi:hypothetical protein